MYHNLEFSIIENVKMKIKISVINTTIVTTIEISEDAVYY